MKPIPKDRVIGCILGGAIGDAAASPFEGQQGDRSGWRSRQWCYSDDTQLTLATCQALTKGAPDAESVAKEMLAWYRARRLTGLGASTLKALRDLSAGGHWALVGRKGEFAAGNGAAMRIAPVAFVLDPVSKEGRQLVRDVSRITHHHEEAYVGAYAMAVAVALAAQRGQPPLPQEVASHLPDCRVRDRLCHIGGPISLAAQAGSSGYVVDSVPLALLASSQIPPLDYELMIDQLIQLPGDVDTIASMAGQVAGAALGSSGLPSFLLQRLPEQELLSSVVLPFADRLDCF